MLRFGLDQEVMDSNSSVVYPGDGMSYQAQAATPGGSLPNGAVVPAGVTAIVDARHYVTGAPVSTATLVPSSRSWVSDSKKNRSSRTEYHPA